MITQEQFRSHFDIAGKRLFFNHAAYSPISRPVVQAINAFFEHRQFGDPVTWNIAEEHMENLRANYGKLVGAPADRIAHMANTVSGISPLRLSAEMAANSILEKSPNHALPDENARL